MNGTVVLNKHFLLVRFYKQCEIAREIGVKKKRIETRSGRRKGGANQNNTLIATMTRKRKKGRRKKLKKESSATIECRGRTKAYLGGRFHGESVQRVSTTGEVRVSLGRPYAQPALACAHSRS